MASPAASLGHPDSQQDTDFFGTFGSPAQPSARSSPEQQPQHQQAAMDPFDLFGEGSTVSAPGAAADGNQHPPADDGLFGDVEGHEGGASTDHAILCDALIRNSTTLYSLSNNLYTA